MSATRREALKITLSVTTLGAAISFAYALSDAYAPVSVLRFASATGWLAGSLLALALCVTPLQHVWSRWGRSRPSWLGALRRSFGIAAASCSVLHGGFALFMLPGVSALLFSIAWLRAGLLALCILMTLFVTSFDPVLRRLRLQHWKELHRLVYPAAFLLAMHVILGPFGSPAIEVSFFSFLGLLLALRLWPLRSTRTRSND
jgi:sulfoxide reductase heme-binding subunit YedZ